MNLTSDRTKYGNIPFAVPYSSEKPSMVLFPNESRVYHGFCIFIYLDGVAILSNPNWNDKPFITDLGEVNQSYFRITAGDAGCEFSILRVNLN